MNVTNRLIGGSGAHIRVVTGNKIPNAIYGQLRRRSKQIFIVAPFLEDYEFFGRNPLSRMLEKQLSEGAAVMLLTMPPEGTNGTARAFTRKFRLMESLRTKGAEILFNRRLHAKIFLFDESEITKACLLGSANMTTAAMNDRLEIAMFTHNRAIFQRVRSVLYEFQNAHDTVNYLHWRRKQFAKIKSIVGVS